MMDVSLFISQNINGRGRKLTPRVCRSHERKPAKINQTLLDMNSTADPLHVPEGPIIRSKVKNIQEAYTLHLQKLASVQG